MAKGIIQFYKSNSQGMFFGIIWGIVAVAIGTLITQLADVINKIMDFILQVLEWILVLPAKVAGFLPLQGIWLYVVAGIIGALLGPLIYGFVNILLRIMKKSPI